MYSVEVSTTVSVVVVKSSTTAVMPLVIVTVGVFIVSTTCVLVEAEIGKQLQA